VRRRHAAIVVLAAALGWAVWSYASGGVLGTLLASRSGAETLEAIRAYVLGWGALAPLIYVGIVTAEVVVAPIPGAMLYAPGGAIFGGFVGGTLALAGNTIGAAIASWLAATFGAAWVARRSDRGALASIHATLAERGGWLVFLLRLNPFTSSDLVSYAAGLAGVPPSRVALGTLFGMAPQCYAQAYLAATLFQILPLSPALLGGIALVVTVGVVWVVLGRRRVRDAAATEAEGPGPGARGPGPEAS
jgi:uncharacterized membrane protein YdjX (TVP38/TMEM64 family)